jgi:hypothetical protein
MSQAGDDQLNCPELSGQINANRIAADEFVQKDKAVQNMNTAKAVTGFVLLGPLGLAIVESSDMSHEDQVKARSLIDRNEKLLYLAKNKGCSVS